MKDTESNYPPMWKVCLPTVWHSIPTEMSFSHLVAIEECPRRWALESADYPQLWGKHGYPPRINLPSTVGTTIHSVIEIITRALAQEGVLSTRDERAVEILIKLGGLTKLISKSLDKLLHNLENNPRTELVLDGRNADRCPF
jgi:hypothetical protein